MPDAKTPVLAIACIVKNEVPYLLEWIAYHRALGVTRFFIADNGSSDGTRELLSFLGKHGFVKAISFPGETGKPSQLPAYATLMRTFGGEADWIAFIDADEFFLPTDGARSLLPFITSVHDITEAGALAVNWAVFGSSGHLCADSGLLIERFTERGVRDSTANHHYKSIIRSAAYHWTGPNPHAFQLNAPFHTVTTAGVPVEHETTQGISRTVSWEKLRLNHYVTKSFEEFLFRKRPRGRADVAKGGIRSMEFFAEHDLNEEHDPVPAWLIEATRIERNAILAAIRQKEQIQV